MNTYRSKHIFTRKGSEWYSAEKASHYVGFGSVAFLGRILNGIPDSYCETSRIYGQEFYLKFCREKQHSQNPRNVTFPAEFQSEPSRVKICFYLYDPNFYARLIPTLIPILIQMVENWKLHSYIAVIKIEWTEIALLFYWTYNNHDEFNNESWLMTYLWAVHPFLCLFLVEGDE